MTLTLTQGNHKVTDDLGWGQGRSRQNTHYPPNSVGWGARLGALLGGGPWDELQGQTPWGGMTAAPHSLSDVCTFSQQLRKDPWT